MSEARSTPRPLPDQAARNLIIERLDLNLLVEAGAGSGKTESLARRMAAGVAGGAYTVDHMAAVTFTRKAAAELRGRFQTEIERLLAGETEAARRRRLEAALGRLERLFTGTIHSFCARLLRERPVEAGVAPGFVELDDVAERDLRERAWRDYLDRARATGSPLWGQLVEAGVNGETLHEAFETVCLHEEVEFPAPAVEPPDPAPAGAVLDDFWRRLEALLPDPIARDTSCEIQRKAREFRGRHLVADRSRPAAVAELLAQWERPLKLVQRPWGGTAAQSKATARAAERLVDELRSQTAVPYLAAWRHHLYGLVVRLLTEARHTAAEARRRAASLSYGDLLRRAATLLRDDAEARAALQARYRWLFVDEFQDTDPIQAEVIFLLAAESGPERDWTRVGLRPGALFIVGDPKQSIFRFRRADIDTYTRVKERVLATGGLTPELTVSFRAVPALCAWANLAFPRFFPQAATPQQPFFHGLVSVRDRKDARLAGVRQLPIAGPTKREAVATAEAEQIARWIRAELDTGRLGPRDVMIITRKRVLGDDGNVLPIYARALERLRIPFEVSGDSAFVESESVATLAGLLYALADPDDGPAVVGVLRGPLFGLSDRDLWDHRQAGLGFRLTTPLPDEAAGPVPDALRALGAMYRWTRTLPAPAAVARVLEATGLLARGAATPAGAEAGHLLHAVDRVRQVTEQGGTLADAAGALEEDLASPDVESVPLEPGRRDVVRLMNLHKAKGLEAKVVFLADPRGGVRERADVRIVRDGRRALGYFRVTRRAGWREEVIAEPEGWPAHERDELAYVRAEEHRLLYVASTRARDLLVVGRSTSGGQGNIVRPWEPLAPDLVRAPALTIPAGAEAPSEAPGDLGPVARAAAEAERRSRRAGTEAPSWTVESVTATAHRAGAAGRPPLGDRTREPDTGMAWGALVHALLEEAMRGPRRDRGHLERLARWLTLPIPELRAVIPEALDTVGRVMGADFWQRAMAAEERQVEAPFAVRVAAGREPPRVLHGVVDLAFRTRSGWELVDYKTDQVTSGLATLVAQYSPQIHAYASHWSRLVGETTRPQLYFVRAGELHAADPAPHSP